MFSCLVKSCWFCESVSRGGLGQISLVSSRRKVLDQVCYVQLAGVLNRSFNILPYLMCFHESVKYLKEGHGGSD